MRYKVRDKVSDDIETQILVSRGIENPVAWKSSCSINDWRMLDKMQDAVEFVDAACKEHQKICVVVDQDVDGFTSAAIVVNFLLNDIKVHTDLVTYLVHDGKQHGLADMMDLIPADTQLLIVPDAGTSDYDQQDVLTGRGCKVVILDHHQSESRNRNPDVVTVNPQLDDYPNKALTGAGVTWQFARAYAELVFKDCNFYKYMDLCAFGNISDMADSREMEIRAIVRGGLSNITNPFMSELTKKNEYTINKYGGLCYKGCAFGLTPFVNAICRSGTIQEKRQVFEAMLENIGRSRVPSGKRGEQNQLVSAAEEAVRVALNVKARQTKQQNALVDYILDTDDMNQDINVVVCDNPDARPELLGLTANKFQDMFKRPAIMLMDYPEEKVFRGSARNCEKSPIKDFRKFCQDSGLVNYAMGHPSAFGIEVSYAKLGDFMTYCSTTEYDFEAGGEVDVDFEFASGRLPAELFNVVDRMADCLGQQVPEVKIVVEDIPLSSCKVELLSADKNPTLKLTTANGIQLLKFHSGQHEVDVLTRCQPDHTLTVLGTPGINRYKDLVNNQIIIDEYELKEEWVF